LGLYFLVNQSKTKKQKQNKTKYSN
jgi:hypothetical protein